MICVGRFMDVKRNAAREGKGKAKGGPNKPALLLWDTSSTGPLGVIRLMYALTVILGVAGCWGIGGRAHHADGATRVESRVEWECPLVVHQPNARVLCRHVFWNKKTRNRHARLTTSLPGRRLAGARRASGQLVPGCGLRARRTVRVRSCRSAAPPRYGLAFRLALIVSFY